MAYFKNSPTQVCVIYMHTHEYSIYSVKSHRNIAGRMAFPSSVIMTLVVYYKGHGFCFLKKSPWNTPEWHSIMITETRKPPLIIAY